MRITRVELYCRDAVTSDVLRALAKVKGVLADPPPRAIPMDDEEDEPKQKTKPKNSGPRTTTRHAESEYGTINYQVLDALAKGMLTKAELVENTGLDPEQVGRCLHRLYHHKKIRRMAHGKWKAKPA
jgi:hypothetical protein